MKRIHVIGCILPLSHPSLPREQCVKWATVQKKISDISICLLCFVVFLKLAQSTWVTLEFQTAFRCGETGRKYLLPCSWLSIRSLKEKYLPQWQPKQNFNVNNENENEICLFYRNFRYIYTIYWIKETRDVIIKRFAGYLGSTIRVLFSQNTQVATACVET